MKTSKEKNFIEFKFGSIKFLVKKEYAFVFYATFIAGEYNDLKIKKRDTVLDLGANVGDFTIKASKLLKGTGKIIAIEPNHENIEILKINLELNDVKNAEIMEYAITDKDGYSYLSGDSVGAEVTDNITNQKIRTMSVNSLLEKLNHPKDIVVKMDIEGAERYFFNNQEFINSIREIVIELHGKENVETIPKILEKNNFKLKRYTFKNEFSNTLKSFLFHPIDFIRCEKMSNWTAIKGAVNTLITKRNPIPSINSEEFILIYAYRKR